MSKITTKTIREIDSEEKKVVRTQIAGQLDLYARQFISTKRPMHGVTLTGDNFEFCQQLHSLLGVHGRELVMDCAERVESIYESACKLKPSYVNMTCGELSDLYSSSKTGAWDFLWADYCGNFNPQKLAELAKLTRDHQIGMVYATFCLVDRNDGRKHAIDQRRVEIIKDLKKSLGGKLVYSVTYMGGKDDRTTMFTVGVRLLPLDIPVVTRDDRRKNKLQRKTKSRHARKHAKGGALRLKEDALSMGIALNPIEFLPYAREWATDNGYRKYPGVAVMMARNILDGIYKSVTVE